MASASATAATAVNDKIGKVEKAIAEIIASGSAKDIKKLKEMLASKVESMETNELCWALTTSIPYDLQGYMRCTQAKAESFDYHRGFYCTYEITIPAGDAKTDSESEKEKDQSGGKAADTGAKPGKADEEEDSESAEPKVWEITCSFNGEKGGFGDYTIGWPDGYAEFDDGVDFDEFGRSIPAWFQKELSRGLGIDEEEVQDAFVSLMGDDMWRFSN